MVVAAAETLLETVLQRLAAGPATPAGATPTGRSAATAGRWAPGLDDAGGGLVVEDAEGDTAERHQESEDPQGHRARDRTPDEDGQADHDESTAELTVRRGNGKLTVELEATDYSISRKALPQSIKLTATVTDPDGRPLAGADVTFTLSIPGIRTVTAETKTNENGRASYETTIPRSADRGQGSATVLISSDEFGSAQDVLAITIARLRVVSTSIVCAPRTFVSGLRTSSS